MMKKSSCYAVFFFSSLVFFAVAFAGCTTKSEIIIESEELVAPPEEVAEREDYFSITFAGDIMAHSVNHNITKYDKIWKDVKQYIECTDLAVGNIESPVDTTKEISSYPTFNLPKRYVEAAIDAGFDAFSLANNHTFDQGESGIQQTIITTEKITAEYAAAGKKVYFSGLKKSKNDDYTYNLIEKNGWKILFLPISEILNFPYKNQPMNFVQPTEKARKEFALWCKKLRQDNPCDLFIISIHANEPEYTRKITKAQRTYYHSLLNEGEADVIWANHAHIIKDREFVFDSKTGRQKLIMYANGNTISGQRTKPELENKNPTGERDNTGDGLLYNVTFYREKRYNEESFDENGCTVNPVKIYSVEPVFITTYINTAWEFVLKPLNQEFVDYLKEAGRTDWKQYIERRITINNEQTKDLITWQ